MTLTSGCQRHLFQKLPVNFYLLKNSSFQIKFFCKLTVKNVLYMDWKKKTVFEQFKVEAIK